MQLGLPPHTLALLLFLSASSVTAEESYFISVLEGIGLTSLADAVSRSRSTPVGQDLLSRLDSGSSNYVVFAPTNEAIQGVDAEALGGGDANTLASIISYHIVAGNFVGHRYRDMLEAATWPNITVAESLLTSEGSSSLVNLEEGKGQACLWARHPKNDSVFVRGQSSNTIASDTIPYVPYQSPPFLGSPATVFIIPVSGVFKLPGNLSSVFEANDDDGSSLAELLKGRIMDRFESDATRGFTFFAPNNEAIEAAGSSFKNLAKNKKKLGTIMGNHYVNGSTFYSTQITDSTDLVSAFGQPFKFTTTSNGTYVTSGKVTAKIVDSNYLVKNGVIHWIDKVLLNFDEDTSAAQFAYERTLEYALGGCNGGLEILGSIMVGCLNWVQKFLSILDETFEIWSGFLNI